jgi:hypothetical protein
MSDYALHRFGRALCRDFAFGGARALPLRMVNLPLRERAAQASAETIIWLLL